MSIKVPAGALFLRVVAPTRIRIKMNRRGRERRRARIERNEKKTMGRRPPFRAACAGKLKKIGPPEKKTRAARKRSIFGGATESDLGARARPRFRVRAAADGAPPGAISRPRKARGARRAREATASDLGAPQWPRSQVIRCAMPRLRAAFRAA